MKSFLKRIISQRAISIFYHLPKAILANILYGFPSRRLKVIGVTGTDGKTTTTSMIYQILKAAGKKVSMVSTVNAVVGGKSYDTGFHVTSPDSFSVQKFANKALRSGDEYLILEVTSHGLDQYRFWGAKLDVAVITNITHEHLDYHKTYDSYFKTKLRLIKGVKFAVLNQSIKDDWGNKGNKESMGKIITFGLSNGDFNQKDLKLKLKLIGDYNIENALVAMAVAFTQSIDRKIAQKALEDFEGVEGRMQEVKNTKGVKIIIDFAHTPNGLEQALKALRSRLTSGRLVSLIGCEGFRDEGKRVMMGEIAQELSNIVIVTSVDPRGQIEIINRQITEGAQKSGAKEGINFFAINDRQEAINFAINTLAKKGDTIGIFGKGHERSMNLDGKKELPWSDYNAIKRALNYGK